MQTGNAFASLIVFFLIILLTGNSAFAESLNYEQPGTAFPESSPEDKVLMENEKTNESVPESERYSDTLSQALFEHYSTGYTGSHDSMTALRNAKHLIVAPNGHILALINRGSQGDSGQQGLLLIDSTNGGYAWNTLAQLYYNPRATNVTGSMILADNGDIYTVYAKVVVTAAGAPYDTFFRKFTWNGNTWTMGDAVAVYNAGATDGTGSPDIIEDSNGVLWCTFSRISGGNYTVRLYYSTDQGSTWTDTTQVFGDVDRNLKFGHLQKVGWNRVGLFVMDTTYIEFQYRTDSDSYADAWSTPANVAPREVDQVASHLVSDRDSYGNIHFVCQEGDGGDKRYYYYDWQANTWGPEEVWETNGNYPEVYANCYNDVFTVRTNKGSIGLYKRLGPGNWIKIGAYSGGTAAKRPVFAHQGDSCNLYIMWQEERTDPFRLYFGKYIVSPYVQ